MRQNPTYSCTTECIWVWATDPAQKGPICWAPSTGTQTNLDSILLAVGGDETERVNRACVLTKRQGRMCQQVSIGPLKRLKFNWSTSLGAGRPKYKCPATSNRFDSYLYMCDGRLQVSVKWMCPHIVRVALPLNFGYHITIHTTPPLTANKSFCTCLFAFYFRLHQYILVQQAGT